MYTICYSHYVEELNAWLCCVFSNCYWWSLPLLPTFSARYILNIKGGWIFPTHYDTCLIICHFLSFLVGNLVKSLCSVYTVYYKTFSPTIIIESFRFLFPISLPALRPSSSSGSGQFGYHRYYRNWIGSGRICTLSMGVEDEFPWKWKTQSRGGRHLSSSPQTCWILFSFPRVRPQLFDLRCTRLLCLLSVTWFYGKQ